MSMKRKLLIAGALGLVLAVAGCRNPDDRRTATPSEYPAPTTP
jgi:hypothetical protein